MSQVNDVKAYEAETRRALDALVAAHDDTVRALDARIVRMVSRIVELEALLVEERQARHAAATELAEMKAGTRGT